MKKKPLVYPVPKYIIGIKNQGLRLWDDVKLLDWPVERKARLAFRLSVVCRGSGDKKSAEELLTWARGQIPKIPLDGCYSREFAILALSQALWRQGLKGQAEKYARGLPGQVGDILYREAAKDLLNGGQLARGWQMASRCSESQHQADYLKMVIEGGLAVKKALDVPRLLSGLRLKPDDDKNHGVHTFCQAAQCWMLLKAPDQALKALKQAEAIKIKRDPHNYEDRVKLLLDRLEITEGYFDAGRQQQALEMLVRCRYEHELLVSIRDRFSQPGRLGPEERLDWSLGHIAALEMQYGSQEAALEMPDKALGPYGGSRVWAEMSRACLKQRRFKRALELASRITEDYTLVRCHGEIVLCCRQEKMKTFGERAWQVAQKYARLVNNQRVWLEMSQASLRLGDSAEALRYLAFFRRPKSRGQEERRMAPELLVENYALAGQYYMALELAKKMEAPWLRLDVMIFVWERYNQDNNAKQP